MPGKQWVLNKCVWLTSHTQHTAPQGPEKPSGGVTAAPAGPVSTVGDYPRAGAAVKDSRTMDFIIYLFFIIGILHLSGK